MDVEHLTPYLRRRVLKLSIEDRLALRHEIDRSLSEPLSDRLARLSSMVEVMKETSELDVLERNRRADYVRARVVLCFVAKQEGFSQHEVGKALGLNHSTVCYHEKVMDKALSLPGQYADYINLYNKFTNAILCQNN